MKTKPQNINITTKMATLFVVPRVTFLSFLLMAALFFGLSNRSQSQALTGTTGYFNIPSGEIHEDKTMFFGTNRLHRNYKEWGSPDHHAMNFFVTASYFPFAEISIRFTRIIGLEDYSSTVGDRMASARLQAVREGRYRPAIVIGVQNFFTTLSSGEASHFNSTYLAATKNFQFSSVISNLGITAGYGTDILVSANYQFLGLFGGVKITPQHLDFMELMFEYDGDKWNAGTRITILRHIVILAGMEGLDVFSGGVSFRFKLP